MRTRVRMQADGFTLIELLVGLTLLGLVSVAFYGVHRDTQHALSRAERGADMQQNARGAMAAVIQEIRNADAISTIGANSINFMSDQYVRGQERVISRDTADYDHNGTRSELLLTRTPNDDGSPGPVVEKISDGIYNLAFRYYGTGTSSTSGDEVAAPLAVRRVSVQVDAESAPSGTTGRRTISLTSQVRPRNLGMPPPPGVDSLPPAAPTGLTSTPTCGTLTLRWRRNAETDVVGYRLYYDTDGSAPYTGTGALQGNSPIWVGPDTLLVLTGLNRTLNYTVAVKARDALMLESNYSTTVTSRPTDTSAPPRVSGVGVRITGEASVRVSWTASTAADVAYYRVSYDRDAPGTPYAFSDTTSATSKDLTGLVTGSLYYFVVYAVDRCGNTSVISTPEVSTRPLACSGDTTPPARPTGLAGVAGEMQARISWNANAESDLAGYRLSYSGPGGYSGSTDLGLMTVYTLTGLEDDQTYGFQLQALDVCGNASTATTTIYVTPQSCIGDATAPARPRSLTLLEDESPMGDQLEISWQANTESDLAGYLVYTETGGSADTLNVGDHVIATVTGLTTGTTYHCAVVAYDRCDHLSTPSAEIVGTPRATCTCFPDANVTAPDDGETIGDLVMLSATAAPCEDGTLSEVIFYFDNQEAGHFTSPPYWTWYNTRQKPDGWYHYSVLAVDSHGCTHADTVALRIDNSHGVAPCVNIDPGVAYAVGGDYHQVVNYALIGTDSTADFSMGHALFYWDAPEARLHQIEAPPGTVVWDSGSSIDHAATSGSLFPLSPVPDVSHDHPTPMVLRFWNAEVSPGSREEMDMSEAMLVGTFFSSAGQPCGPDTISTACRVVVTGVSATTASAYSPALLAEGDRYYTDRFDARLTDIPAGTGLENYEHLVWVKTFDGDSQAGDGYRLSFHVDRPAIVYVGYDQRYVPPPWIHSYYTDTGNVIGVTDTPGHFELYQTSVPEGNVTLYGNYGVGFGSQGTRNYVVLLRCQP